MAQEKNYEEKIKAFLKEHKAWFVKYWSGGGCTKSGVPDILCGFAGAFIGIEVKADKGKPSKLQLYNLRKIDKAGCFALLLYPKHWELFKELIEALEIQDDVAINQIYEELRKVWIEWEQKL